MEGGWTGHRWSKWDGQSPTVNSLITQDSPLLVFRHCVCHCLNLAVSHRCAGILDMTTLQSLRSAVYNFTQLSPTRLERFRETAAVLAVDASSLSTCTMSGMLPPFITSQHVHTFWYNYFKSKFIQSLQRQGSLMTRQSEN